MQWCISCGKMFWCRNSPIHFKIYAGVGNNESKQTVSLNLMLDQSVDAKKFEKMQKHNAKSIAKPRGK